MLISISLVLFLQVFKFAHTDSEDKYYHPRFFGRKPTTRNDAEDEQSFWNDNAKATLKIKINTHDTNSAAKNVIFFLGDGMSVPTIAAARKYLAAEESELAFDKFSYTAISKTYCVDYQVPDSACTATAYLGGVKNNMGTIGVNAKVKRGDCKAMTNTSNHVNSIAYQFQATGKRTGIVTTTAITDASPSGVYAHTAERGWQSDSNVIQDKLDPKICTDIATQLIFGEIGQKLNVILGGGRKYMIPRASLDEEGDEGYRSDGVNLIEKWINLKQNNSQNAEYVWNKTSLLNVNDQTEYLLGLFESGHCKYNLNRDQTLDPSLAEMTEAAIKILEKSDSGYFLFVEGGRIDHAHHETKARLALDETIEFSKAIERAVNLTNEEETLIIVTSDHSHTISYSGYPVRGSDILGIADYDADTLPYTTINYANGPGYKKPDENGIRINLTNSDLTDYNFEYPANFPLSSETHGGEDVIVFAKGPHSHLFSGVIEQSVIPHILAYASCIDDDEGNFCSSAGGIYFYKLLLFVYLVFYKLL